MCSRAHLAYKSIGEFDVDVLTRFFGSCKEEFENVTDDTWDLHAMEVDGGSVELWLDDYDAIGEGAWVEAGTFAVIAAACSAAQAFPEEQAIGVYDYTDGRAKLMVREDG